MAPIMRPLPWEEEMELEINNERKSYKHTEPVSEYEVHVAVKKEEEPRRNRITKNISVTIIVLLSIAIIIACLFNH
jgi:hypothetical protein